MKAERILRKDVSVERNRDGSLLLAVIAGGHRVKQRYFGYPKRTALTLFMQFLREQGHLK